MDMIGLILVFRNLTMLVLFKLTVFIWPLDFTFFKFVKTDTVKSEQRWRGEGDGDVQLAAADWRRCAAASVGVVLHSPLGSHCSAPKLHQVWLLAFSSFWCYLKRLAWYRPGSLMLPIWISPNRTVEP